MSLDKVTAVIVLYDASNIVLDCIKNLENIKLIIVDNGRNDNELIDKIKKSENLFKYIKPERNLGFGKACNLAYKQVKTEFTLFIEADVLINTKNIENLISSFLKYPKAAITAPVLCDSNGKNIDKLENLPEYYSNDKDKKIKEINNKLFNSMIEGDVCVNFCWAAIFLTNNKIIDQVGLFNEKYFLFWEDFDLCRKLRKLKIPIIKSHNSFAEHKIAKSTKNSLKTYFIIQKYHILSSYIYFDVNKKDKKLFKKLLLYLFRSIAYLFILNIKKSIKNIARLSAVTTYILK
tara:strand:+ start:515 stop:1387 length:873 start_codon:yes stop_codon:yes gene_type:complete